MRLSLPGFIAVLAMMTAALAVPANAAVGHDDSFKAVKLQTDPPLDGTLSDPVWQTAVTASNFMNITTRQPAGLATTAYLLYDDHYVYVGFRAEQPGISIHDAQTANGVGFGQDDAVGVGIDTSGQGSQVYYFEATPRGTRYQQSSESSRYAPLWQVKTAISGSNWSAMFQIPISDLRAAGGSHLTWRFNFVRIVAGVGEHYSWAYNGLMQDAQPPTYPFFTDTRWWPTLTDLSLPGNAGKPKPRAEIYGLSSIGLDRDVFQQANQTFAKQPVRNYGLDFVYPLASSAALVGTLNPDFSNVEVDQQTIVPQEFQQNLAEYRPFFAQGAQYFNPNPMALNGNFGAIDQILYTPSIGTFDRAFKVEGTEGTDQFGVMQIRGLTGDNNSLDDQAFGFKHALSDRSFLYWADGVLAHHGGLGNDSAYEGGIAGRNLKSGLVYGYDQSFENTAIISQPDQTFAYTRNTFLDDHRPNYEWYVGWQDISPGWAPLDGFTNYNDARGPVYSADFTTTTPGFKSWNGYATVDRYLTRSGIVHAADFFGTTDFTLHNLIHLTLQQQTSSLDDPVITNGENQPFHQTTAILGYRDGTSSPIDFSYGAGPWATYYLQQFNMTTTSPIGSRFNVAATYAGTHERSDQIGVNGQILRSLTFGTAISPDASLSLSLRSINGTGGFAMPGVNFAGGFHWRFRSGSELFMNYGSPAAPQTLYRFITKFLWRIGGGAGT
ncbi:MAG: hypothetical protein JOZ91_06070 [Candidatus Eremiobacteraeota bacterium]|nr:hypothetical protein [Candidatus Eremiobacteraeota bacterium]